MHCMHDDNAFYILLNMGSCWKQARKDWVVNFYSHHTESVKMPFIFHI